MIRYGIFILRMAVGSTFLLHGLQKVFGLFQGSGISQFAQGLVAKGVPIWLSYLAALFEFIGGILIILGLGTEIGACMGICVMIGAIVLVHGKSGYFLQQGGFEYAWNLLLCCLALLCTGPGAFAVWDPFIRWRY
jgi:putative oxidoreductase